MIGEKRAGLKASALGTLANRANQAMKDLAAKRAAAAPGEVTWNELRAAKELEAARQRFEVEKYRAALRVY